MSCSELLGSHEQGLLEWVLNGDRERISDLLLSLPLSTVATSSLPSKVKNRLLLCPWRKIFSDRRLVCRRGRHVGIFQVKASQTARAVTCWGARTPEACTQFRPRALIFTARTHMTMHWCCMFDTACQWKCRPVRGEAGGLQGWGSEPRLTIVSA